MKILIILLVFTLTSAAAFADLIIGKETVYIIKKSDTLELIGAHAGVDWRDIAKRNAIDIKRPLRIGQELRLNTRKIVPKTIDNGIIINIPDRMLYFFKDNRLEKAFPVGAGMPLWRGITRWRTPTGRFTITGKRKNPTWHVPPSMQWKMKMEGKPVQTVVPPGPDNPLGRYALDTSIPKVIIHETIWPNTVYQFRSHGCVRVLPKYMEEFFKEVKTGTPGEIIYRPVKLAVSDGRVYIEVHRDIYREIKDIRAEALRLIEDAELKDKVDWQKLDMAIRGKAGIAEDITLSPDYS
ncbi:MAG: L,D-transpeptidase family protein [Nitrospirae bacterium]|nr:L,D-transpeptidase family protein [Nitrospirota bacterium]